MGIFNTNGPPAYCSVITDNEERCRLLIEAATPFVDVIVSDPRIVSDIERIVNQVNMFTGVQLGSDLRGALNNVICRIASMPYLHLLINLFTVVELIIISNNVNKITVFP